MGAWSVSSPGTLLLANAPAAKLSRRQRQWLAAWGPQKVRKGGSIKRTTAETAMILFTIETAHRHGHPKTGDPIGWRWALTAFEVAAGLHGMSVAAVQSVWKRNHKKPAFRWIYE